MGAAGATAAWMPKVSRTLLPPLVRQGLSADEAAEVVQEVFARALASRIEFKSARAFYRWCWVVSRRLARQLLVARERVELMDAPDEPRPDPSDPFEARLALEEAMSAFRQLPEKDRRAIVDALRLPGGPQDERDRKRLQRARERLRKRLRGSPLVVPALTLRLRDDASGNAAALAAGVSALVGATALFYTSAPSGEPQARRPTEVHVATRAVARGRVPTSTVASVSERRWPAKEPSLDAPGKPVGRGWSYEVPWSFGTTRVDTSQTGGAASGVGAGTRKKNDDDKLACVGNMPVLGTRCIDHIVR